MTSSWENQPLSSPEKNIPSPGQDFDRYQPTESEALELTRARQAAIEQKLHNEQLAVADEIDETIGALVDLLAEIDYPGAEIVKGVRDGALPSVAEKRDLIDIPLWLLDVIEVKQGTQMYGFGADRQPYIMWGRKVDYLGKRVSEENLGFDYFYYVPAKIRGADIIHTIPISDALNRFEIPVEDTLLQ